MISFHVPGIPKPKQRPRISTRNGIIRSFTPAKTVAFEGLVAMAAKTAMNGAQPIKGPVHLIVAVGLPIPQSWSKKKKAAAALGELKPTGRPDIDNFVKAIADGGNGILWNDDAQITGLSALKSYSERPGTDVYVNELS